jgi:hypothetical protein
MIFTRIFQYVLGHLCGLPATSFALNVRDSMLPDVLQDGFSVRENGQILWALRITSGRVVFTIFMATFTVTHAAFAHV